MLSGRDLANAVSSSENVQDQKNAINNVTSKVDAVEKKVDIINNKVDNKADKR